MAAAEDTSRDSSRDRAPEAVAAYKRLLAAILERRPSGTRQRLAAALAKNRSFVSQITNASYPTPIPASHLPQIFECCHFSAAERQEFTRLYARAHPKKMLAAKDVAAAPSRGLAVELPDLGSATRNRKLHGLVSAFVRDIARLIDEEGEKGKGR